MTTAPAAVVRSYLDAFVRRDPDEIAGHVSASFVNEHTAALGSGCVGRDAYRERLPGFLGGMAGLRYDIEDLIVDGSRVVVLYTMTADWQGSVPISVRGAQRLVVEDGLITHRTDYWDSAVFLAQADPAAAEVLRGLGLSS